MLASRDFLYKMEIGSSGASSKTGSLEMDRVNGSSRHILYLDQELDQPDLVGFRQNFFLVFFWNFADLFWHLDERRPGQQFKMRAGDVAKAYIMEGR